ncbi:MAG: YlxR family protein [Clostridia bacterium]|nr:YlxR family protein [Clostridia bacterium]
MKHVPQRMCAACRQMKNKSELVRIVKTPEGNVELDLTGKKSGRGAYCCKTEECVGRLAKTHALERAFGCSVPREVIEELEK